MQLANYNKPFASKKVIDFILELLSSNSRHVNQLTKDVLSRYTISESCLINTANLLIDQGLVLKDSNDILSANPELLVQGHDSSATSLNILTDNLLSKENIEKFSNAIVGTQEYGLCFDGYRVPQAYMSFFHIYFDFQVLESPKNDRFWPISPTYLSAFVNVLPSILIKNWEDKNAMSLDDLKEKLKNQELAGAMAEEWVVTQERLRLKSHPLKENIVRISSGNVTAGFDIASFKNHASFQYDKFIEVKSYTGNPKFYISANEFLTAKELGSNYYLLLVDRDKMNDESYSPIEIINPYNTLMGEDVPEGLLIEPKSWEITFPISCEALDS